LNQRPYPPGSLRRKHVYLSFIRNSMRRIIIIISILLSFISCKQVPQKEVYINEPKPEPLENYSKETFTESFFSEQHFGLAQFMKYDSSGKLVYQYPGGLNNSFRDTTKYYHSSEIIIQNDTARYFLRNCTVTKSNDSLLFVFNDRVFSRNDYEMKVMKNSSSVQFQYNQTFSVTDSSYRPPTYSFADEGLLLDKKEYAKGDSIKGKLHVTVIGHHTWPKVYIDTATVHGLFKAIVE